MIYFNSNFVLLRLTNNIEGIFIILKSHTLTCSKNIFVVMTMNLIAFVSNYLYLFASKIYNRIHSAGVYLLMAILDLMEFSLL